MSDKIELFYAPTSPYVRKVIACAIERGIADRILIRHAVRILSHGPITPQSTISECRYRLRL
jgi:hypothetical protein